MVRCRGGDAACASPVRELSHAPPMRLRSRDPIGCSRAVVSAMGTVQVRRSCSAECARVDSRVFLLRKRSISPGRQVIAARREIFAGTYLYRRSEVWVIRDSRYSQIIDSLLNWFACGFYFYFVCESYWLKTSVVGLVKGMKAHRNFKLCRDYKNCGKIFRKEEFSNWKVREQFEVVIRNSSSEENLRNRRSRKFKICFEIFGPKNLILEYNKYLLDKIFVFLWFFKLINFNTNREILHIYSNNV